MEANRTIYDFLADAAQYLNAVSTGDTIEISEGTFDYFLNVLPPVYMNRRVKIDGAERLVAFGLAEGCEPIVAFWGIGDASGTRYFCQRTPEINNV